MTEQQQPPETPNTSGSNPSPTGGADWRELRRQEREARWHDRAERWGHRSGRGGLIWGGVLIVLGIVLFLQNRGILLPNNWWAVFILIPAFGSFVRAWDTYHDENRITRRVAGAAVGGTLLTVLALMFLLEFELTALWPVLLIVAGIALILTGFVPA
ncbi:MAG TPA: hypothetical protein VFH29_05345 [Anaerolineales bacterium]|nr:hypothetical protein [Anaerolineales bacterium]